MESNGMHPIGGEKWVGGRFRLEQHLGSGGIGSVYAARHRNGARVAIKVLRQEWRKHPVVRERFSREPYLANSIEHGGAVQILEDEVDPTLGPFLVMELLSGKSLDQLSADEGALSCDAALRIAREVLSVLEAAHSRGIVHRDIKPANLFLCDDGRVRVLDFGLATVPRGVRMRRLTQTGVPIGTPAFMAPEQARGGAHQCDGRADLYSLGATLFLLLSGRYVRQGSHFDQVAQAMTTRAPRLAEVAPWVPEEVCAIVDRALAFDPGDRFASATEMADAIDRVLYDVVVTSERHACLATQRLVAWDDPPTLQREWDWTRPTPMAVQS